MRSARQIGSCTKSTNRYWWLSSSIDSTVSTMNSQNQSIYRRKTNMKNNCIWSQKVRNPQRKNWNSMFAQTVSFLLKEEITVAYIFTWVISWFHCFLYSALFSLLHDFKNEYTIIVVLFFCLFLYRNSKLSANTISAALNAHTNGSHTNGNVSIDLLYTIRKSSLMFLIVWLFFFFNLMLFLFVAHFFFIFFLT